MPVFVVQSAKPSHFAAHPDSTTYEQPPVATPGNDFLARVGSATCHADGSCTIRLWALPVDGTLFMRAPQPGEHFDPALSGGR